MGVYEFTTSAMSTVVSIQVVNGQLDGLPETQIAERVAQAMEWFHCVERACSRFDADSELRQLCTHVGTPVAVSAMLFEALQFSCAVAAATDGVFDPTVGVAMESLGFDRAWRTGVRSPSAVRDVPDVTWRDVTLDDTLRTVTLAKPMVIDLGSVAKGLAIDLAAKSLADLANFAINAGGDIWCAGCNADGEPWSVGVQHPRDTRALFKRLRVSNAAVCTSGDYARHGEIAGTSRAFDDAVGVDTDLHHLIDPRTRRSARALISATVVAPSAMVADALATAAFVLGADQGLRLLEEHDVHGLLITRTMTSVETAGMHERYHAANHIAHE